MNEKNPRFSGWVRACEVPFNSGVERTPVVVVSRPTTCEAAGVFEVCAFEACDTDPPPELWLLLVAPDELPPKELLWEPPPPPELEEPPELPDDDEEC
jgi:hypothetical protein